MKQLLPFLKLFKRQWLMMFVGLFLSITTLMAGIGLLSLSGWFLSATAVAGLSVVTAQAFNYFTPAGGVRFLSIARTASRYGERLATHEATFKLLTDLRSWTWRKLLPLSASDLKGLRGGDLLNRLVSDIDTLDHLYLRLMTPMAASFLMIAGLYLFLGWFDTDLALTLCSLLLLFCLLLPLLFYRLGHQPGIAQLECKRHLRVQLLQYLQGQSELTLFGALGRFRAELDSAEARLFSSQAAMAHVTALSQGMLVLCHGFAVVVLFYLAADGVGDALPPGPMLALVVFMTLACIEMLMPLAGAFQHLSACVCAATRVNEVALQTPSIVFDNQAQHQVSRGALEIKQLGFSYQSANEDVLANTQPINKVLDGINLTIKAGEKVALLGQTGCGKSSLLALILRQWQAQQGEIFLDDRPVEQYSESALRRGISVMSQRIYLFAGTLRDNLILAQLGDSDELQQLSRADRKAKRQANDHLLIEVLNRVGLSSLTQGEKPLDTWVGEGGRQLSGGEQRRIGVARVLLRDAPLLLLDEPTEGLDQRTEREIMALLLEFAKDKTLLMISHRLTAMAKMDCVHLMEAGKIRISGSHQQLLAQDDYYLSLHQQLH
ncbi:cysteine/glutathione ABC transporter ATP-binding protein/permease CydC [Shewanella sp. Isolate11]|uniref:heme ABC transporter ATP-binding protein/permease CydC n=1 Tax=Shewanella sp. Isolate11 TaxID=2908530 RepID=UPI001EFEBE41|nr:cysteine/glutathione ABC transporter ATP-binding protein/permease CydC [Shewanella sp. Isolate11]MCG9697547.1 cysteine/glutathione ABC transporter ATP-binding protein/permease CydC [Shewanella sp. Isolate11]